MNGQQKREATQQDETFREEEEEYGDDFNEGGAVRPPKNNATPPRNKKKAESFVMSSYAEESVIEKSEMNETGIMGLEQLIEEELSLLTIFKIWNFEICRLWCCGVCTCFGLFTCLGACCGCIGRCLSKCCGCCSCFKKLCRCCGCFSACCSCLCPKPLVYSRANIRKIYRAGSEKLRSDLNLVALLQA